MRICSPRARRTPSREPDGMVSLVLANPPFGRSSSIRMIGEDGRASREEREIERADFWATTSNKQLNFVQHIASMLEIDGRTAVVLPGNALLEGGAGGILARRALVCGPVTAIGPAPLSPLITCELRPTRGAGPRLRQSSSPALGYSRPAKPLPPPRCRACR
ncbi:N-6 DNA methylase [Solwaraspora sp. WMMD791]|uniref:N-6 DNA methylase n=1 Tax=Solwaraspora sp. WMMD791 TaxID=3016086 RepID=UPI00249A6288|nr:N-6 DNA methylase [Solwaraspora sp. WMMD791]WFE30769.1 N-6 DNA methylase [Solwaraspora sp. WMMD791]